MPAKQMDKFSNLMYGTVTESAASTLTFAEINTNVSVWEKRAFVLHRLEWNIAPAFLTTNILDGGDIIDLALTNSQQITSLTPDNPAVIDRMTVGLKYASAVGGELVVQPWHRDFTGLPGGGLLIAPRPLFLAVKCTNIANACTVTLRARFTVIELTADEYLELVDFYRIVS